jgi:hypothetical protein
VWAHSAPTSSSSCWSDDALHYIGNSIGIYIDRVEPKENMFSCARICVEVDLEKGILKQCLSLWKNGNMCNNLIMNNSHSSARFAMSRALFKKL